MWKCTNCGENNEMDVYKKCYKCGFERIINDFDKTTNIKSHEHSLSIKNISKNEVVIVDIQIPFGSMVVLMVKSAFAAIPAMFIVMLVIGIFFAILRGLFM